MQIQGCFEPGINQFSWSGGTRADTLDSGNERRVFRKKAENLAFPALNSIDSCQFYHSSITLRRIGQVQACLSLI
jgi:hypothetical protein